MTSLAALPNFLAYFAASAVLLAAFLALYTLILPGDEWAHIRQGNAAAALSLGGAMVGFCLPLASAIVHSANFADMVVWAAVALVLQLLCFGAMHLFRRDIIASIAHGDMASAIFVASGAVVSGILNAACLG